MTIKELIKEPEGRRFEFKGELPKNADLANTLTVVANDGGGATSEIQCLIIQTYY